MARTLTRHRGTESDTESDTTEEKTERKGRRDTTTRRTAAGWGAYSERKQAGGFDNKATFDTDVEYLLHFTEDGPFHSYNQHFLRDLPQGVKKSYVCPEKEDPNDVCPLDAIGEKKTTYALLNVLVLAQDGKAVKRPAVKVWQASPTVAKQIEDYATAKRTQPIDRLDLYFIVKKTETKQGNAIRTAYTITPMKYPTQESLEEDGWDDLRPLTADELETWRKDNFDDISAVTKQDTVEELEELIEKYDL